MFSSFSEVCGGGGGFKPFNKLIPSGAAPEPLISPGFLPTFAINPLFPANTFLTVLGMALIGLVWPQHHFSLLISLFFLGKSGPLPLSHQTLS